MRDEFTPATKTLLAKQAGYRCAHPHCGQPTVGANGSGTGIILLGEAAHITAAAVGGPRYDPTLASEERKHANNGLWLCRAHARAIDADSGGFSVEQLQGWKKEAARRSFVALGVGADEVLPNEGFRFDPADSADLRRRFNLTANEDFGALKRGLLEAAREDASAFRRTRLWPDAAIDLTLRLKGSGDATPISVRGLSRTTEAFNEIVIFSPPGTGKTTTLLQLAEAIVDTRGAVASFVLLDDWAAQPRTILESLADRHAFRSFRQDHLRLLAYAGELTLILDGWNQLGLEGRRRARQELDALRRDYPKLGIVISSRDVSVSVPFASTVVALDPLDFTQQRALARALRAEAGEMLLEAARATPGLRDLVAVPLYLTALLKLGPGANLPATKERILAAFVAQRDQAAARNEVLREVTFDHHQEILSDLAAAATRSSQTFVPELAARASVQATQRRLLERGLMGTHAPQPSAVLDALVAEHLLVRSAGASEGYSFQHQQFQEWYASFIVEAELRDLEERRANRQLLAEILDSRPWEEAILFACERLAAGEDREQSSVANAVRRCLSIDPMLSAEMIFRAPVVWPRVEGEVTAYVTQWHQSESVDRAIGFVVNTGRPTFDGLLWSLISKPGRRLHLEVMRAGRRFPPTLLPNLDTQLATLEPNTRAEVLGELVDHGGIEGALAATSFAQADSDVSVKTIVVEALYYAGADQQAARLLAASPPELWRQIASRHSIADIHDAQVASRLALERRSAFDELAVLGHRLYFLLNGEVSGLDTQTEVVRILLDPALDVRDDGVARSFDHAYERFPTEVAAAVVQRLAQGLPVPFRTAQLAQQQSLTSDAPSLQTLLFDEMVDERLARDAAGIAGPQVVGALIDRVFAADSALRETAARPDATVRRLHDWILASPRPSLFAAVLQRSHSSDPRYVGFLASLLGTQQETDTARSPAAERDTELHEGLVVVMVRWASLLASEDQVPREDLAHLALAMGATRDARLAEPLDALLSHELRRWAVLREALAAGGYRDSASDARVSWIHWYRRAFVELGGEVVERLLLARLPELDFGAEAAAALVQLWERQHSVPRTGPFHSTFLGEMAARRGQRLHEEPPAPVGLAILDVARRLLTSGVESQLGLALRLSKSAFRLPCGDLRNVVAEVGVLSAPLGLRLELYESLALAGERLPAPAIQAGLHDLVDASTSSPWVLGNQYETFYAWARLLAFSDNPGALVGAVMSLPPRWREPHRLRGILHALGTSSADGVEAVLLQLSAQIPLLLREHDWFTALRTRGTVSSGRALLNAVTSDADLRDWGVETFTAYLAELARAESAFRAELLAQLAGVNLTAATDMIERALQLALDTETLLTIIARYARTGRSVQALHHSLEKIVLDERPSTQFRGAIVRFPRPAAELRRRLFSVVLAGGPESTLAEQCLIRIDTLRDEYGAPEAEPRHPELASGQPWPRPR